MKRVALGFMIAAGFMLVLQSCAPAPTASPTAASTKPSPPAPTPTKEGAKLVVTTTDDPTGGPNQGTLRWAIEESRPGDSITFDPAVFPPDRPATIQPTSELPPLSQGRVSLDASNAGVILDGGLAGGGCTSGVVISSDSNTVRGLRVENFTGAGIIITEGSANNVVGGDPNVGSGPLGQGNVSVQNADGMGLFGAHDNAITGNWIGTDVLGTQGLGNRVAGIFVQDGSSHNLIGPQNVIVFNGGVGVDIRTADSTGNTVTRNSIHENGMGEIVISGQTGLVPAPPSIFDFDLAAGTVAGATCPSCAVEIFSDKAQDAQLYEAGATADSSGSFSINAGHAFAGPGLTATSTLPDGATSMLSAATSGPSQSLTLQQANTLGRSALVPAYPPALQDTRIGDTFSNVNPQNLGNPADMAAHSASLGHTWIRLTFGPGEWSEVESTGRFSPLSFGDFEDQVVDHLNAQGVTILYDLLYFNKDIQVTPGFSRFRTEADIQDFVKYARMVVAHFKGRIHYYETWNEPDLTGYGQQGIAVQDYVRMIKALVPAIHEVDPQAKVVVGGGSDLRQRQVRTYLMAIVSSDIMPLVDGLSIHPMYGSSPDYDSLRTYYYMYPDLVEMIKKTAAENGFKGEYFAEEMAWRTKDFTTSYEVWTYSQTVAAKYYGRGIVINRGLGLWAGIGGEGYPEYAPVARIVQSLNTIMGGAQPAENLPIEIQTTASMTRSYAFTLPNGEKLIALWNDGGAVDADPGVPSTIVLPGMSDRKVTGIDPLSALQQQLVTQSGAGKLTVPGFLLKDYPVFLRIMP